MALGMGAITFGSFFPGNTVAIYAITAVSAFGMGFCVDLMNCAVSVQIMKCVEEAFLARAVALLGAGGAAAIPVTSFLLSILVKYIPVKEILMACSAICVIIFVVTGLRRVQLEQEEIEEKNETERNIEQAC